MEWVALGAVVLFALAGASVPAARRQRWGIVLLDLGVVAIIVLGTQIDILDWFAVALNGIGSLFPPLYLLAAGVLLWLFCAGVAASVWLWRAVLGNVSHGRLAAIGLDAVVRSFAALLLGGFVSMWVGDLPIDGTTVQDHIARAMLAPFPSRTGLEALRAARPVLARAAPDGALLQLEPVGESGADRQSIWRALVMGSSGASVCLLIRDGAACDQVDWVGPGGSWPEIAAEGWAGLPFTQLDEGSGLLDSPTALDHAAAVAVSDGVILDAMVPARMVLAGRPGSTRLYWKVSFAGAMQVERIFVVDPVDGTVFETDESLRSS